MTTELDFHLDDFEPADSVSELAEGSLWTGDLTVLAEHHTTPNRSHSYLVAHDASAIWGVPGDPQLVTIKIARDLDNRTYTFEAASHAGLAFAQKWLDNRDGPMPEPPEYRGDGAALRTRAALTRSTSPSAIPKAGLGTSTAPTVNTAQRPNPWRSM